MKKESNTTLKQILALARKSGYKCIAVNMVHPKVKSSERWPFPAHDSMFGEPVKPDGARNGVWPAIWNIPKALGYNDTCGNGHQTQCYELLKDLEPQTWEIQKDKRNRWVRIA